MAARVKFSLLTASRCLHNRFKISTNPVFCNLLLSQKSQNNPFNESCKAFLCTTPNIFAERKFSKKHEWVTVDGKIGTVGISDYAQELLGDVVYVQLPEVGSEYDQDDECGAVESVKAASEIYTPVSGKVTEINSSLEDTPALVNQSCYDKGWLFRVELSKPEEHDKLLSQEQYDKYLKTLE